MNLKPLNDNIIVKPTKEAATTKSGIVLPESAKEEKPEKGEVLAVGAGRLLENGSRAPLTVKTGDRVIFKKYSPDEIKIDGEEYLILGESDILAIME
jgi:chaperonin GroES